MTVILQRALPPEMAHPKPLPGVAPCAADDWLRVDDSYAAQMRYRAALLHEKRDRVLWLDPAAAPAAEELLTTVLGILPQLGFTVGEANVVCPDQRRVPVNRDDPLHTLGHLVQQDLCILEKRGKEHLLTGAVLCFPANWRLADKVGRGLVGIHDPVEDYVSDIARRVQRLFDGVQVGRPLWRSNLLTYADADLHQPYRKNRGQPEHFVRAERQCILRLPETQAVIFAIHTFVVQR